jgi:hypothetical protein
MNINKVAKLVLVTILLGFLGGCVAYPQSGGAPQPGPCEMTLATMESASGLMNWASNGGQGQVERRAQANAHEGSMGRGGYNCNAQTTGVSRQVNGMEAPPRRVQPQQQWQPPQQWQSQPHGPQVYQPQGRRVYRGN